MRRGHLIILFTMLFILLILSTVEKSWQYERAAEQKRKIDEVLVFAADTAAEQVALKFDNSNIQDFLKSAESEFFRALAAGFSMYDEFDGMDTLDFYVPLLIATDTEGFYMNYLQEGTENGAKTLSRVWTECQPYCYYDAEYIYRFFLDDTVYIIRKTDPNDIVRASYAEIVANASLMSQLSSSMVFQSKEAYEEIKRAAIAQSIETMAGRIMNEHNYIAGQYGVSMYYGVPSFFDNYTPALNYASFMAVFQGYPLSLRYNIVYNNCAASAAYITRTNTYTVELSTLITQPFSVYHRDGCSAIGSYGIVLEEKVTKHKAVSLYGAYACPDCFTEEDDVAILP